MKKKLLIFGLGDMGRMAYYYFSRSPHYEVVAFTLTKAFIKDPIFESLPVVEFENIEKLYPPQNYEMFIAIGYSKLNQIRADFYSKAKAKGYKLASFISPHATVLTEQIGENTFIFEDNTVQPFVKIGNNVILWSGNHVGHDAEISDHCFITSHVVIAGWVHIGKYCFLGVNSTIRDKIKIGERNVIGAGALITKDTEPGCFYKTKPAELSAIPVEQLRGI